MATSRFLGLAEFTWTDSGAQTHVLRTPLQEVRPAKDVWAGRSQSVSRQNIEITEVGGGCYEILCRIRWEDAKEALIDLMAAGWRGITLRYTPDTNTAAEFHDCVYMGPNPKNSVGFDVDQKTFDEVAVEIRLRRTDCGSFDQAPQMYDPTEYYAAGQAGGYAISEETTGLLNNDDFERANNPVVGGSPAWVEQDASYEIESTNLYDNQATWSNVFCYQTGGIPAARHGFVIQANIKSLTGRFHGVGVFGNDDGDTSIYGGVTSGGNWEATRYVTGSPTDQDLDATRPSVNGSWYGVRLMITQNGSNVDVNTLSTDALADEDDLTEAFVETGAALTNVSRPTVGNLHGPTKWNSDNRLNEYIVMGNENGGAITITGVPTGYKIQIGTETAVVESGGTVTIPMSTWKTWAFPQSTIKLLTGGDVEVADLTLPDDIWGGHTFSVAET